jgi:hypothetical protein
MDMDIPLNEQSFPSVKSLWKSFEADYVPYGTHYFVVRLLRFAFYSGAMALMIYKRKVQNEAPPNAQAMLYNNCCNDVIEEFGYLSSQIGVEQPRISPELRKEHRPGKRLRKPRLPEQTDTINMVYPKLSPERLAANIARTEKQIAGWSRTKKMKEKHGRND